MHDGARVGARGIDRACAAAPPWSGVGRRHGRPRRRARKARPDRGSRGRNWSASKRNPASESHGDVAGRSRRSGRDRRATSPGAELVAQLGFGAHARLPSRSAAFGRRSRGRRNCRTSARAPAAGCGGAQRRHAGVDLGADASGLDAERATTAPEVSPPATTMRATPAPTGSARGAAKIALEVRRRSPRARNSAWLRATASGSAVE